MRFRAFYISVMILIVFVFAQRIFSVDRTVGVIKNDMSSTEGFTLFAPMGVTTTYLIDSYGRIVHHWESQYSPNLSVYMNDSGDIIRSIVNSTSDYGVQKIDWDGNILWEYIYDDPLDYQHHDIEPLPNGNVLLLVRDIRSGDEFVQAGRDPSSISTTKIWSEKIVEVEPTGLNTGNIVWEWSVYDHLIQDFDPTKDNYGNVVDHPELMDVNFTPTVLREWLHANAIDYNDSLDQIIINMRNISEFWIIDHSTTIAEASAHNGGTYGKGGDILYRWGNPTTYRASYNNDQKLFYQHDARWVEYGLPGEGNITVFNNGVTRPDVYSSVDEMIIPINPDGSYSEPIPDYSYGPVEQTWIYTANPPESMYSSNISGARRLMDGNTLICEGANSHFYEVTQDSSIVWEYISPAESGASGITQGDTANPASVFRCERFTSGHPVFSNKDLTPKGYIEINPIIVESTVHNPEYPTDIDQVTITSKIYDDSGIVSADLHIYFGTDSLISTMNDSGTAGDITAGDSVYTATIPALPGYEKVGYYIEIENGSSVVFRDPPFASQNYYFSYETMSSTPANLSISRNENTVSLNWDPIAGVSEYKVYSSDDPYIGFNEETTGNFSNNSWFITENESKKFYYVVAVK